jgi:hypothetical protein
MGVVGGNTELFCSFPGEPNKCRGAAGGTEIRTKKELPQALDPVTREI